jgi:ribose transport system substrate-binding protein
MMKKLGITLVLVMLIIAVPVWAAKTYKFGVSLGWIVNDYGMAFKNEIEEDLAKTFPGCKIYSGEANYDPMKQSSQIENFINMKVDALFVTPCDPSAIVPALVKAEKAGIPIFIGDSLPEGVSAKTVAMSNNFAMGYYQAIYLCKKLNGKGRIAAINLPENSTWYERTIGLYMALEQYPNIKLVAEYEYIAGGIGALTPKQAAKNILTANPNPGDIDAFWCSWDGAAVEAAEAIEETGRTNENIIVTGIDGFEQSIDYIRKGTPLKADMAQSPREMARTLVECAKRMFENKPIPHIVITPVYQFTSDKVPAEGLGPYGFDKEDYIINNPDIMNRNL